jgi:hypothetical protein
MLVKTMNLAKNLGEELGLRKSFKGAGAQISLKILLQICENPEKSQKVLQKCHFLAKKLKKVKILFKNAIFSKNFIRGEGTLYAPTPRPQ